MAAAAAGTPLFRPQEEGRGSPSYLAAHDVELVASLAVAAGLGWALAITSFFLLWVTWRKYKSQKSTELTRLIEKSGPFASFQAVDVDSPGLRHYGWKEIASATDNLTSLVGKEEFWEMYLAYLPEQGTAVVRREVPRREYEPAFESQVASVAKVQHQCLVDILGFCDENGEHMIVFEYLPMGTLYDRLHLSRGAAPLTWAHRMHIAYNMASGLEHLHQYVNPPITHGNFKSSRIYLGDNFSAKVADWCLLRLKTVDASASNAQWAKFNNTLGFPESPKSCGIKNDVYNFGLILLELLSGVPESEVMSLWTEKLSSSPQDHLSLVDPLLGKDVDQAELHAVVEVAKMCVNSLERRRPCMLQVERIFKEKLCKSLKNAACEISKKQGHSSGARLLE